MNARTGNNEMTVGGLSERRQMLYNCILYPNIVGALLPGLKISPAFLLFSTILIFRCENTGLRGFHRSAWFFICAAVVQLWTAGLRFCMDSHLLYVLKIIYAINFLA